MLIAERLTKVYGRTDGGPGKSVSFDGSAFQSLNAPNPDTPCKWWNMVRFLPIGSELCIFFFVCYSEDYNFVQAVPIVALIAYIAGLLVWTGQQSAVGGENMYEIIGMANSYTALLWGVSAFILSAQIRFGTPTI